MRRMWAGGIGLAGRAIHGRRGLRRTAIVAAVVLGLTASGAWAQTSEEAVTEPVVLPEAASPVESPPASSPLPRGEVPEPMPTEPVSGPDWEVREGSWSVPLAAGEAAVADGSPVGISVPEGSRATPGLQADIEVLGADVVDRLGAHGLAVRVVVTDSGTGRVANGA